jgi:hypothetical protein
MTALNQQSSLTRWHQLIEPAMTCTASRPMSPAGTGRKPVARDTASGDY